MIVPKSFILLILLLFSFEQPRIDSVKNKGGESPDSLRVKVVTDGWTNYDLNIAETHINNSPSEEAADFIKDLPGEWEKTYLNALLLKKEGSYAVIYDSLFNLLDKEPLYLPYYNLLIFSAAAANRVNFIEEKISGSSLKPLINNYLISLILKSKTEYSSAMDYALRAYEIDSSDYNILFNLYDINRNAGDYENGMNYVSKIIGLKNLTPSERAEANFAAGTLFFLSGKYNEAAKYYKRGFDIASKSKAYIQIARGSINLGIIEDLKGNVDEARVHFSKAVDISGFVQDLASEAHALSELGVSYSFTNQLIDAKRNYLESYNLFKNMGNRSRLAYLSENLGKIYLQMFDYRSALKYYEEGIEYAGENKRAQVLNLTGIADVYANLSNYTKALLYYKEAEKIASGIKDAGLTAEVNLGMGLLNYNLNRNYNALKYLNAAGEYSISAEDPFLTARIYREIGLIYTDTDSLDKADDAFKKARDLAKETGDSFLHAQTLIDIGTVSALRNGLGQGLTEVEQGLRIAAANNFQYLSAYGELTRGEILEKIGNFNPAKNAFQKCADLSEALNEKNLQIAANQMLAELFSKNGFSEAASSYYMNAMRLIEDVSHSLFMDEDVQISYFSGKRDVYDSYAEFLLNNKYFVNAFEVIEKSRSRSTIQHIANLKLQEYVKDEDILNRLYEYDWIINSGLYEAEEVDSVNYLYTNLKKDILIKNQDLSRYFDYHKTLEVKSIQEKLGQNENLISLYTNGAGTYLFYITRESFTHNFIPLDRNKIINLISSVSPYFNNSGETTYFNQHLFSFNAKAANELYEKVFKVTLKDIPEGAKIIFSPSPEFSSFPLEFLVRSFDTQESPFNYKDKDFLVKHYNISYTPSINTLIEQKQNKLKNNDKVLVVGNPSINKQLQGYAERRGLLEETGGIPRNVVLLPLKYSAEEVSEVSSILNADKILLDNSATETNFKNNASFSSVIHLSTHSFLHNKQPVIFFSNSYDAENDGFLEAGEIVQMQLNSDLVVLSSCNSGLGRLDESEGVLGMAKAFFETGTKSVIVSLWEVNDKYTSVLMKLFYERLKEGYDKSEALRMAKLDFIRDYSPNPYYWSAFILNGDTSELQVESGSQIQIYIAVLALILLLALIISVLIKRSKTEILQQA